MYVLWLASWFPNRVSPYNGDFIARHAVATALYSEIVVVHVVKDEQSSSVSFEETQLSPGCKVITAYYPRSTPISLLEKLLSSIRFVFLHMKIILRLFRSQGKPIRVHLHIIMNAGFIALLLKWNYGIPYIVSEQATHYLQEDGRSYLRRSFLTKWLIRTVLVNARHITSVSSTLAESMKLFAGDIKPIVIPNVVDRTIFFPGQSNPDLKPFILIHISNLFLQKNTAHILKAYQLLEESEPGMYRLIIAGGYPAEVTEQVHWEERGVEFIGEMDQHKLAQRVRRSHALILYSLYETFGCVLIEAMACGIPVLVSDIPVFHEIVRNNINGCFVPPEDPDMLAGKIREMRVSYTIFNKAEISKDAINKYGFEPVGKMFNQLYSGS